MQVLRRILGLREAPPPNEDTLPMGPPPNVAVRSTVGTASQTNATAPLDSHLPNDGRTRNLEQGPVRYSPSPSGSRLIIGQRTDVGQVRDNNQDSMSAFTASISSSEDKPDFGLFIVADGMGGHEDGEKASGLATRIVTQQVLKNIYLPLLDEGFNADSDMEPMTEVLKKAIQKANENITTQVPDGGTTVTAVAIMGYLAYVAHVGDTRAYMINQEGIEQLTRDHSLVQRLIELGQLTPEEAAEHPQKNVLYRAIGQNDALDVDAITRQVTPGSYILICSDGLWNLVSSDEILSIVLNNGTNTGVAAKTLVDLANERGGSDNITVIIVRIPE
jgi:protein phosphatase